MYLARRVILFAVLVSGTSCASAGVAREQPGQRSWHTHRVVNDEVSLEVRSRKPCARAEMAPVLLVPGMTGHAGTWLEMDRFMKTLEGACPAAIVSISLRGRGASGVPESGWTPEDHAGDIAAVVRAFGWSSYHMVAHSMGVAYALEYLLADGAMAPSSFVAGDYFPGVVEVTESWRDMVVGAPGATDGTRAMAEGVLAEQGRPVAAREFPIGGRVVFVTDNAGQLGALPFPMLVILGTKSMPPGVEETWSSAREVELLRIEHGHDVFRHVGAVDAVGAFLNSAEDRAR